jgi:hypothetical protein
VEGGGRAGRRWRGGGGAVVVAVAAVAAVAVHTLELSDRTVPHGRPNRKPWLG